MLSALEIHLLYFTFSSGAPFATFWRSDNKRDHLQSENDSAAYQVDRRKPNLLFFFLMNASPIHQEKGNELFYVTMHNIDPPSIFWRLFSENACHPKRSIYILTTCVSLKMHV